MSESASENISKTLAKLPVELQTIIRRKCSRDPKTRFTYKIHLLLAFVLTRSQLEDEVGIGWVSEHEFRINKKKLVELLGIKMNSMNVNLHDLGFHKMQHEKNGWTRWTRDGFTQNKILMDTDLYENISNDLAKPRKYSNVEIPELGQLCTLGSLSKNTCDLFINASITLWKKIFNIDINGKLSKQFFIEKLAYATKALEQSIQNALDVIESIFESDSEREFVFYDFFKFLSMFGPIDTSMIKIGHLAKCTLYNNWIFFKTPDPQETSSLSFYGQFDSSEPNCFVVSTENGISRKVWNMPLINAYGNYLIDDNLKTFCSWGSFYNDLQK